MASPIRSRNRNRDVSAAPSGVSSPRRRGPREPVADRFAQSLVRDRRDGDPARAGGVERAQDARTGSRPPRPDRPSATEVAARCRPRPGTGPKPSQASPSPTRRASSRSARLGRIVRGEHARRERRVSGIGRLDLQAVPSTRFDCLARHAARPQQAHRSPPRQARSSIRRRPGRPAVERSHRCARRDRRAHGPRVGRADMAGAIGRRRRDGPSDACSRARATGWAGTRRPTVSRPAVAMSRDAAAVRLGQHQRHRAGPERARRAAPRRP